MALEDRDRSFEKALARHLRSGSPAEDSAVAGSVPATGCPDAETLAAYHDGTLLPGERGLWKQHVLSCANCQLVLEHLATPLDVPVNADQETELVAAQTHAIAGQADSLVQTRAAAPPRAATPKAPAQRAPTLITSAPPRKAYFRWLVPTGAIAASLLAWVVIHESQLAKQMPALQGPPPQVAENREPQSPEPVPSRVAAPEAKEAEASAAPVATQKDKALASRGDLAAAPPDGAADALRKKEPLSANSLRLAHPAPERGLLAGRISNQKAPADAKVGASAAGVGAASAPKPQQQQLDVQSAALQSDMVKQGVARQAPLPSDQPSFVAAGSVSAPAATVPGAPPPPPPAPVAAKAEAKTADKNAAATTDNYAALHAANSEVVQVETKELPSASRAATSVNGRALGLHVVASSDGKSYWRLGPFGSLEFSKNKGKDWIAQSTGVATELLAASAPSAKVCWVVGRVGTILLTTDGGAHWTKLASPVAVDLVGVQALDAQRAIIFYPAADPQSSRLITYQTTDGGATWLPAPSK
jgi:hypothetical protein